MNYGQIYDCDPGNGPGLRVSLFVSGCTHHCPSCFNEQTWDFSYGEPYTAATQANIIEMLNRPYIQGLTVLGGEPMESVNQKVVWALLKEVREKLPTKDIWIYSGYTFEELLDPKSRCHRPSTKPILELADVLVDGRFVMAKKDVRLTFRGSRNQRVLDLKESLHTGQPCWVERYR